MGIPYVPGLPIVGNIAPALFQKQQVGELFKKFYNMFPNAKYFGIFDCNTPVIVLRDPDLIKQVAIKSFDNFTDHYGFTSSNDKFFSNALFSLRGERWKEMRSFLSPSFTSSKLKSSFATISTCAKCFVDSLEDGTKNGPMQIEMKDYIGRYTNDIICKYAFGINVNSVENPKNEIFVTGKKIFAFDGPLSLRFFLLKNFTWISNIFNIPLFSKVATDFFTSVIKSTIAERDKYNIKNSDMLQVMVDASRNQDAKLKINMNDIMSQTFIFFFGGFDTTSSYLSSTLHLLATYPEVYEKLQAEIDEVYERTNGNPTYDAIQEMSYLECVLNESGRICPPVPYLERVCTKSFELPPAMPGYQPLTIEPGTAIYLPSYALQTDPQYFPEPDNFDPERFREKTINFDSGYYMPFGVGRRICIGARLALMEMKLLLFHILSQLTFKPCKQTVRPMKFATNNFIMTSHNKVWLQFEKRNKK